MNLPVPAPESPDAGPGAAVPCCVAAGVATSIFQHAGEGVVVTDLDGRILEVNDAFTTITGYRRDEVMGRTPAMLSSGRHDADFYRDMWRTLRATHRWTGEIWNRRPDGEIYAEWLRIVGVQDERGEITRYVGIFTNITAQKHQQESLERVAHYDLLTDLPNRALMLDRLTMMMVQADRERRRVAVCYLDLDDFKTVNDRHGPGGGDRLLIDVAARLRRSVRSFDTVARLGGDEFVLLLGDIEQAQQVHEVLARVLREVAAPGTIDGHEVQVTTSIGASLYPDHGRTPEHLLREADQAMYRAKLLGKDRYWMVEETADLDRAARNERLRAALLADELVLHFQPTIDARGGRPHGAEALVRWQHPERGLLPPGQFLPDLTGTPLEIELDLWVAQQALAQLARWQAEGWDPVLSINMSAATLTRATLPQQLAERIAQVGARAHDRLEIEVLETAALTEMRAAAQAMTACRQLGLAFALDDFGTGYSSLAYLRQLPVQTLKIDQSFVRRMLEDPNDMHIVRAVIGLAQAFGIETVAEGVETDEQASALAQLGCDRLQGYGIARPMPAERLVEWWGARAASAALAASMPLPAPTRRALRSVRG